VLRSLGVHAALLWRAFRQCLVHPSSRAGDAGRRRACSRSAAKLLGCRASEVVFTSGGTKPIIWRYLDLATGDHIITSTVEHHAVLNACKHLQRKAASHLRSCGWLRVVDPDDVRRAIRPNTKLITIMFANNETGVVQPVAESERLRRKSTCIFIPMLFSGGKDSNRRQQMAATCSRSPPQVSRPQGVGALYAAREPSSKLCSTEAAMNAHAARYGKRPWHRGLRKAAELAIAGFGCGEDKKIAALRDDWKGTAQDGSRQLERRRRTPCANTTNICFEGIEGEALVIALDLKGLACRLVRRVRRSD